MKRISEKIREYRSPFICNLKSPLGSSGPSWGAGAGGHHRLSEAARFIEFRPAPFG